MEKISIGLTESEQFFFEHAGWSYDPATQTPDEGRARCAILLADAEGRLARLIRKEGWSIVWEDDPEPYEGDVEWDGPVYICAVLDHMGEFMASLCGIAMASLDEPYRRVVEAELASEAI